ncbi:hypothetical protein [Stratiformator vulcanicus]|nr:hypothetical protein [Stratiformator vulcanicus]
MPVIALLGMVTIFGTAAWLSSTSQKEHAVDLELVDGSEFNVETDLVIESRGTDDSAVSGPALLPTEVVARPIFADSAIADESVGGPSHESIQLAVAYEDDLSNPVVELISIDDSPSDVRLRQASTSSAQVGQSLEQRPAWLTGRIESID